MSAYQYRVIPHGYRLQIRKAGSQPRMKPTLIERLFGPLKPREGWTDVFPRSVTQEELDEFLKTDPMAQKSEILWGPWKDRSA